MYSHWHESEQEASCYRNLVIVIEKQYGADSPFLSQSLNSEAKALRAIGNNQEADEVETRANNLGSAAAN